jgi:DNA mismatch repair protein MutS
MDRGILDKLPATPMWEQYRSVKLQALDSLLFYRMGDFYELFLDDAVEASGILGITLTARNKNEGMPIPMCGVPFHAASGYIGRLLNVGKRVAICEQTGDPATTKGIVKREIVRVVSPGIVFDQDTLDGGSNNYLMSLDIGEEFSGHFCALESSTGENIFGSFKSIEEFRDELAVLRPREFIVAESMIGSPVWNKFVTAVGTEFFSCVTSSPDFHFSRERAQEFLLRHFGVLNLEAFGLNLELGAVGAALLRLRETQKQADLSHLKAPKKWEHAGFLQLDESTLEHLDVFPKPGQAPQDSLFFHLDKTVTAIGARKLRQLLARPLCNVEKILERQKAVSNLADSIDLRSRISESLTNMRDLERIVAKIGLGTANPRDLVALQDVFARLPGLKRILKAHVKAPLLKELETGIEDFVELYDYLALRFKEDAPMITREGGIFKSGWHKELDELIELSDDGKSFLTKFEQRERESTGINSLKVKYNRVFGYYIEVTNSNLSAVPARYVRKQTTTGGERFITDELKQFEDKILRAEEKRIALEEALFDEALKFLSASSRKILETAERLAMLDALRSLAAAAAENGYVAPEIVADLSLEINAGRHPALENLVGRDKFIANDVAFSDSARVFLITGPNMAGKSTYMRQVALITLMAHVGSLVPAASAKIGLVDRIATRVGASDRIGRGQSTFMVEMNEMARIIRQASERSLLVIDEIGRGTSTFDGLALAWAILEDIQSRLGSRTLFATHYHELTMLEAEFPRIQNLSVTVEERNGQILFLHKVARGKANGSYGVEVARLAGLPASIVNRSKAILADLEKSGNKKAQKEVAAKSKQLTFFEAAQVPEHLSFLEKELTALDIDTTSPLSALMAIKAWKDRLPHAPKH